MAKKILTVKNSQKQRKGRYPNRFLPGQSGNPAGKPKGTLSLKTRIINDILASYYEKKVGGEKLVRSLPAKGSKGIRQYLDYIVTLIKGEANNPNSGTNIYNIVYTYRGKRNGSNKSNARSLRKDGARGRIPA